MPRKVSLFAAALAAPPCAGGVSPGQVARLGATALLASLAIAAAVAPRGEAPEAARPAVVAAR